MTKWVRIDANYLTNPKLLRAGADGTLMHLASVLYLAEHDIGDGLLPVEALSIVGAWAHVPKPEPVAKRLVTVRLWHIDTARAGYLVHDFDVLNGDRSEAAQARDRKRRERERRALRSVT